MKKTLQQKNVQRTSITRNASFKLTVDYYIGCDRLVKNLQEITERV